MIGKYKYTDKELKKILKSVVILVDKREKKNDHIIKYFNKNKIKHTPFTMNQGDYSFMLPQNTDLLLHGDTYFHEDICIERKNSTDELIGNFANERTRMENEFLRNKGKMYLLIEDEQFYKNISEGNYRSQYSKKSALGTYHSFVNRYNINSYFINKEQSGQMIYFICTYFLRELIK